MRFSELQINIRINMYNINLDIYKHDIYRIDLKISINMLIFLFRTFVN